MNFFLIYRSLDYGFSYEIILLTEIKVITILFFQRYEKEIMVKVDRNNYKTIDNNVKKLKENKINTLIVKLRNAYKPLEEPENKEFVDFVKKMKNESMNIIIGLNPVVTDQYLVQSESSENSEYNGQFDKYASYYIWKSGRDSGQPPNNWVSTFCLTYLQMTTT